jgi:penicillin G amidase
VARQHRVVRFLAVGLISVLVIALVSAIGVATVVRRSWPQRDGQLSLPGLASSVRVLRNDQGVPQIYAATSRDLFLAQGFTQAQDRFFEMDLRRHVTAGRLSELVGGDDQALAADRVIRTMGWL